MKKLLFLLAAGCTFSAYGQQYFQQEVNYRIQVKLDDEKHLLSASETVAYTNNSPDALPFIYFHLWPNAYKNNQTALAKQFLNNGNNSFQFAEEKSRGYIDSLDFSADGKALKWEYDPVHIDICKVYLPEPLKPGATITIATPFRVKIPGDFSRLGHVGQGYQISQWYPKPAVYDHKGWHAIPYLDQGEFYSEFGSFEVKITIPKEYRVAATGELQEEAERLWLEGIARDTTSSGHPVTPASSGEYKTITYKQDRVHDFAWFADERYRVRKSQVKLASGRTVSTWAYFLPGSDDTWKQGAMYVDSAIHYYSEWVGEYPYSSATAVQGALRAGGGMEYPMVTVISAGGDAFSLDQVITHEVGHNWFYGILGSNERSHAWMDEGFNSYAESRYVAKRYPGRMLINSAGNLVRSTRWGALRNQQTEYISATLLGGYGKQLPVNTPSAEMGQISYALLSYSRTAALLLYLEQYLGQPLFDQCMHRYYDTWKFRHPYPEDVQKVFEETSGKDLGWFFDGLIYKAGQVDYRMVRTKKRDGRLEVTVKNKGNVNAPYPLQLIKNGEIVAEKWVEGHAGTQTTSLELQDCDAVVIDREMQIPELNVHNNTTRNSGLFRKTEPIRFNALTFVAQNRNTLINVIPVIGLNTTDKFLLGAAFHNLDAQGKKFNYYLAPMYSFDQNTGAGNFLLKYDFLRNGRTLNKLRLLGQYKRFAGYDKVQPSVTGFFRSGASQNVSHLVQASYAWVMNRGLPLWLYPADYQVASLRYQVHTANAIRKQQTDVRVNAGIKNAPFTSIDVRYFQQYKLSRRKSLTATAFAGVVIGNNVPGLFQYYTAGSPDYLMNQYLIDRAMNGNFASFGRQMVLNDQGSFKTNNRSAAQLVTVGLEYRYKKFPLAPFANFGFVGDEPAYDMGFALNLGVARVYLPVAGDNFHRGTPSSVKNWSEAIRFSLNWNIGDMWNNLDKVLDF